MNSSIPASRAAGTRAPSPHSVLADLLLARKSVRVSVSGSGQDSPVSQVPAPIRKTCTFGIGCQASASSQRNRSNHEMMISS